ncbi:BglG family transcription antiterminator [Cohnella sp.]|uniref:BglG family transcription antiterminator n=1 Tax=Cohnella sp. TaxID=1883426 RepID=UPI0035681971
MKVSNRQRHLLEVLLSRQGGVTAGELALDVQISSRTVHRELQELEPILAFHGLSLVKKSGLGIMLEGDLDSLFRFQDELRRSETETYSPDERKVIMLCLLLEEVEPIKLYALAKEVQAAIPTVSRDLEELEPQLVQSELMLIRKRGYGVEISGTEVAKRRFIVRMAEDQLNHSDFFRASLDQSDLWPTTNRLLDLVGKATFMSIEHSLWQQNEDWLKGLKESDYTRLLVRLSVAVIRLKRGHRIEPSNDNGIISVNDKQYSKLQFFAESLSIHEMPKEEASYMQMLLDEARIKATDTSSVILEKFGLEIAEHTANLILSVEKETEVPLSKDRSLLDGMIRHLSPAIDRIRNGEIIRNPLLSQIKKDYESLFNVVRRSSDEIWGNLLIPEEEIGYLVMHFGAAIERWKLAPGNVRVLLVCLSGIGSSKLLAVRITKEIPQINLLGHYSWYEASRMPQDQYDLIVSTVDLPIEPERYIKLSPLLTRAETEKLRTYVREIALNVKSNASVGLANEQGAWERLKLMNKYTSEIVFLLDRFRVYHLDQKYATSDHSSLMERLLRLLSPQALLQREDLIAQQLMEREAQGSLLIPDSKLALFHTRSQWVSAPLIALFCLESPIYLDNDNANEDTSEVKRIFLMLAPITLNKQALEVLSEISGMLLQPELVSLLEESDIVSIRALISRNMESYLKTKLEWREPS